jgi:hypothetical protein
MRMSWTLLFVGVATAACGVDPATPTTTALTVATASALKVNPATDGTEPAFVNGIECTMVFPGSLTSSTQHYAIWAIGTKGIVDAPYNTAKRPNLYAVFGTHPAAAEAHHVPGFDEFDHYHVLENPPGDSEVENRKWDLLVLVPTYRRSPRTRCWHSRRPECWDRSRLPLSSACPGWCSTRGSSVPGTTDGVFQTRSGAESRAMIQRRRHVPN